MSFSRSLLVIGAFLAVPSAAGAGGAPLQAAPGAQAPTRAPQGPPGTVTLSLADYDRLLDRAENPAKRPEAPPIPAIVARADLRVRVTAARARGTFILDGEVFRAGATRVPLVEGATILSAQLGSVSVPLVTEGGITAALIDGPRPFTIDLTWGAALTPAPGRASLILPVPMAGSAALSLDLPGHPADVRIEPGVIMRTTAAGDETHVDATLVPGTRATLSWSSRESAAPAAPREVRTISDVKTMLSVGEAELRMTALVAVTVLRGEAERLEVRVPKGFSVTGASGAALATTEERPGLLVLTVQRPADRRHQFLLSLERSLGDAGTIETPLVSVVGAERETGEVAVEAAGTVDLTATETDVLRRMDIREASAALRAIARFPLLAALRYHRRGAEPPAVALELTRFPDAPVIAAVAERAVVTTLATVEGRTLTEISLTMRNRAQPFLRVELPQGASIVSAEVNGQASKPAQGTDGTRIPLLRPGFRPVGAYNVSFVYVQTTTPFAKKGRAELTLPKMDVPVSLVEWEMFLPDRYRVKRFEGDALPVPVQAAGGMVGGVVSGIPVAPVDTVVRPGARIVWKSDAGGAGGGIAHDRAAAKASATTLDLIAQPGQLMGRVVDAEGSVLPGVTVRVLREGGLVNEAISDGAGWFLMSDVPSGRLSVAALLDGFRPATTELTFDASNARRLDFQMSPGPASETVSVSAADESNAESKVRSDVPSAQAPSQNVFNLQRRVAGVLPVRIDVPRAGAAYRFVRPLVFDEPTRGSFDYRTK
jgi:hypothetical protein